MRLINTLEESKWMRYKLEIEGEILKVDLQKELLIDEDELTQEVMAHPRVYGFLTRIHKVLVRDAKRAELERKKTKATRIDYLVSQGQSVSGAREAVEKDKKYVVCVEKLITAEYKRDTMEGILESFKHRKDLIQTLSANLRSEK